MFNQKTWRCYRRTAQFRISEFGQYIDKKPGEHNSTHKLWARFGLNMSETPRALMNEYYCKSLARSCAAWLIFKQRGF